MKRRAALLFGLFLLIFSVCLVITSCGASEKNPNAESNKSEAPSSADVETGDADSMDTQVLDHYHLYELMVLVHPSCGVEGKQAYVCVICGKQQHETSIAALPHNYKHSDILSAQPTCSTDGKNVEYCSTCGCTQEEVLTAKGHSWSPQASCDSNTNELVVTPYCTRCKLWSTYEYRYKVNDVKKLSKKGSLFGELDYIMGYGDSSTNMLKAPYYGVYCHSTYLLIVRSTKSIGSYQPSSSILNDSPLNYYKAQGCTVLLEADISITADGRIQFV